MDIGIFIMSCDKNKHILSYCLESLNHFWGVNKLPIYVGVNTESSHLLNYNVTPLFSEKSSWKYESIEQLENLKKINPNLTHVILILDDFIILKNVCNSKIIELFDLVKLNKIKYLKLKREKDYLFLKLKRLFISNPKIIEKRIIPVESQYPYYSSLQISIWEIDYLIELIKNAASIWEFEKLKKNHIHYQVTKTVITYKHVIEKGMWENKSIKLMKKNFGIYFHEGDIKLRRNPLLYQVKNSIRPFVFFIFGYTFLKLRKKIK
jgi:hypothetical protein